MPVDRDSVHGSLREGTSGDRGGKKRGDILWGGRGRGRRNGLSWVSVLLALVAVISTSLSTLSLYHVLALRAEVEKLQLEVSHRRGERLGSAEHSQQWSEEAWTQTKQKGIVGTETETATDEPKRHAERRSVEEDQKVTLPQPCLQMLADSKRTTFQKVYAQEMHTGIPWARGLGSGSALELQDDIIKVNEEGFFFVYSQVYYRDTRFAMGHIIIRMKKNVVGDELRHVVLFRCIQNMNSLFPFNTCYTGGIVKLEVGDTVELLIPRASANVSLAGDVTFLGAIKLT